MQEATLPGRITAQQAATLLGVTRNHISWLVRMGRLPEPHLLAGSCLLLYDEGAVRAYAATRRPTSAE